MEFAQKELKKRGWKRGKGLGKQENGRADAIKVNLKMDGCGLGFDHGEQFTFRWWDHMFSSALNKIEVDEDENGDIKVKSEESADAAGSGGAVSSKRIPPKFLAKEMLYGRFVRGTPTTSAAPSSDSSDSSSEEDDRPALTFEDADEKMLAACGGRTAHKGARHGMGLSGKLARLEQQDAAFLTTGTAETTTKMKHQEGDDDGDGNISSKKKKKKKKKRQQEAAFETSATTETIAKTKHDGDDDGSENTSSKKKRKKERHLEAGSPTSAATTESTAKTKHQGDDDDNEKISSKKKKTKRPAHDAEDSPKKKKKKKKQEES